MQLVRAEYFERRAEEEAAKKARAKEQKERLDCAKQAIVNAMVAMGESEKFGESVAALVDRRGAVFKVVDRAGCVDTDPLNRFSAEAKLEWFERKLLAWLPSWNLTTVQKKEVVQALAARYSTAELQDALRNPSWEGPSYCSVKDALASAMKNSDTFTCPICMDPMIELSACGNPCASKMWFAPLHKNEHWSSQPCGHACCRSCMQMWAETAINDQKVSVRCPAPNCSYSLFDHDVKALVSAQAFERYQEHKNTDYLKHLRASLKQDVHLKSWLKSNARPCPDCHVIVSRYEGCDAMTCVCGTRFCYQCGFKKCKCGSSSKRKDIWNPRTVPRQEETR